MKRRTITHVLAGAALAAGLGMGSAQAAPVDATQGESTTATTTTERPLLRVPFDCGRTWRTSTGDHHRDEDGYYSIDMNWGSGSDDYGSPVLASDYGTAQVHVHSGGYGRHVVVNHGGGWSTLYAHLSSTNVVDGQGVGPRTMLGRLGGSGSVSAPHLHYAQKYNGVVQRVRFGTSNWITYPYDSVARIRDCR